MGDIAGYEGKARTRKTIAVGELGWASLTEMPARNMPSVLRKTIAQSLSLRGATIPHEWNDRPAHCTKPEREPTRPEGGSLRHLTGRNPTKSHCT